MNVDSYFTIGKTHTVCQDYALAEIQEGKPLLIISDGCSSSPDTDCGSRILSRVAQNLYWRDGRLDLLVNSIHEASEIADRMYLPNGCLDATLLMAFMSGDMIHVVATGDGVILARQRGTQSVETFNICFQDGAPGYLSYLLGNRLEGYYHVGWGARTIWHKIDGDLVSIRDYHMSRSISLEYEFSPEDYDLIMLGTDGLLSFQKREGTFFDRVPVSEVAAHLTLFQNHTGLFLTRRARRFLHKWCPDNGWHYNDDVAVAALHLP